MHGYSMALLVDSMFALPGCLRAAAFWTLVYSYCLLYTCTALVKLLYSILLRPRGTFHRVIRESPPGCLNDPFLGTHCYVRIKMMSLSTSPLDAGDVSNALLCNAFETSLTSKRFRVHERIELSCGTLHEENFTSYKKDSGLRFHYVAAGERGKPLMLLLHGFPEFWYSWRHQLREFKSEYRVVALDLRGYGETDAPANKDNYKLDCVIVDVKEILDSLGYTKCVLIGHDWGGMIAWLIAICYPEVVTKLIVLGFPHPTVFTEYILRHPSQLIKSGYYFFFQMPWFPELMYTVNDYKVLKDLFTSRDTGIGKHGCRFTDDDMEAYLYIFSQPGALSGPLNHYRNIFSCLPLKHHQVTMPTLLLWGENDAFVEVEMADMTRVYVKNYFQLSVLSHASHWLQQDQPELVNTLIWTFLEEDRFQTKD